MKKAVTLILLIIFAGNSFCQPAWFRFNNLSEKQGLADANIASVIKDHRGYMWFASSGGLNCFNGSTCRVYHHLNADSNSLSDDNINAVFEDSRNNIWIGTRNGLNLYDTLNDNFIHFFYDPQNAGAISSNEIWSVAEDNDHGLWIGTMGGGLNRLVRGKSTSSAGAEYTFTSFKNDSLKNTSLSSNIIWSIAFDKNGNGWIGTENGLNRFAVADAADNKISFVSYHKTAAANSVTDNSIWKVYADKENNIWLLSFYGMLDCLPAPDIKAAGEPGFIHVLPLLNEKLHDKSFVILSLLKDSANGFWAGTDKQGLLHYSLQLNAAEHTATIDFAEHFLHDDKDNESLIDNAVYSLYEDETGIIWIGTSNGISKYITQKNLFNSLRFNNNESIRNAAIGITYAEHKNIWFATADNKIWLFNDAFKEPRLFAQLDNFFDVTGFCLTQNGSLLIGTSGAGIYTASKMQVDNFMLANKPVALHPLAAADMLKEATVFAITEYTTNQLLVAGYGRLGILDLAAASFINLSGKNNAANDLIFRCIAKLGDTFFIGTDNGLYTLVNNKLELLNPGNGKLNSDRIISLYTDDKNVWIGTVSGLNVYSPATRSITNYSTANGLPDNIIRGISADNKENLWIATRNGLCCYNKVTKRFSIFNDEESINTNQLTSVAFNGSYLFIGGDKGINTIIPSAINNLRIASNIAITDFKIAGNSVFTYPVSQNARNIKQQMPVYIKWNENNISVAFKALDYKNPGAIQYAYILEGFDKDWVYNGKESAANYTNLPGGNYTFRVKYSGSDGVWVQSAIALPVRVSTAWFKSWWFYLLCAAMVIALVYAYYNIRLKRVLELQKMRNKIARDLHDDIGSTLSTINILSGTASKKIKIDTEKTTEMLQKIGDSSRTMMDAMSDIVWSINPDNDVLANMAVRMREYAAQVLEAKDIDYKINIDNDVMNIKLHLDKRRDFYLVFKEAVNNLAKYAQATKAEINLSAEGNTLKLRVQDNGKGFDIAKASAGNGLRNMKQRAESIGGKLIITSTMEEGTLIELIITVT